LTAWKLQCYRACNRLHAVHRGGGLGGRDAAERPTVHFGSFDRRTSVLLRRWRLSHAENPDVLLEEDAPRRLYTCINANDCTMDVPNGLIEGGENEYHQGFGSRSFSRRIGMAGIVTGRPHQNRRFAAAHRGSFYRRSEAPPGL